MGLRVLMRRKNLDRVRYLLSGVPKQTYKETESQVRDVVVLHYPSHPRFFSEGAFAILRENLGGVEIY